MPPDTYVALGAMAIATLGLLLYAFVMLPREVRRRYSDSLQIFATAVELRAPRHRGQTKRVAQIGERISRELGLDSRTRERLETATFLRDIGMCAIPFEVLNREPHEWSEEEVIQYNRHALISSAMLEVLPSLRHLAPVVRCHHAHFNGSSGDLFPQGQDLPIEARIICVATAFAIAEKSVGTLLALEEVRGKAGSQFDSSVIAALVAVLRFERARASSLCA